MRWASLILLLGGCDRVFGLFPLHEIEPGFDATSIDAPPPTTCPPTYTVTLPTSTSRYRLEKAWSGDWVQAANACEGESIASGSFTHLWVISSRKEFDELIAAAPPSTDMWIGYADRSIDTVFEWVTAELTELYPPTQPPWTSDNPDHAGPGCVTLRPGTAGGEIGDSDCTNTERYICECDGYPDAHRR